MERLPVLGPAGAGGGLVYVFVLNLSVCVSMLGAQSHGLAAGSSINAESKRRVSILTLSRKLLAERQTLLCDEHCDTQSMNNR